MDIIVELERFIIDEIMLGSHLDGASIEPEEDLLFDKRIDSLSILKLIDFIEKQYDVKVSDEDIDPDNFCNLKNMKRFIELKLRR